jgi:hypothetical protein
MKHNTPRTFNTIIAEETSVIGILSYYNIHFKNETKDGEEDSMAVASSIIDMNNPRSPDVLSRDAYSNSSNLSS